MEFTKSQLNDGHYYIDHVEKWKHYCVSLKHNALAKFIIEILDPNTGKILYRPNDFLVTALPGVPYTLKFKAPTDGELAVHYELSAPEVNTWTSAYDLLLEEIV